MKVNPFGGCCGLVVTFPETTLLESNVSHSKALLKKMFLFPRWDMLVTWRVTALSSPGNRCVGIQSYPFWGQSLAYFFQERNGSFRQDLCNQKIKPYTFLLKWPLVRRHVSTDARGVATFFHLEAEGQKEMRFGNHP